MKIEVVPVPRHTDQRVYEVYFDGNYAGTIRLSHDHDIAHLRERVRNRLGCYIKQVAHDACVKAMMET